MARPRKPSDPGTWPVPCGRCGGHYQIAAYWPDAAICGYCYLRAKRTRGSCACGHVGILPGRIDGRPACRQCSGVKLNVDCQVCGNEDELYRGTRCWSCELAVLVDERLTNPETGLLAPELMPVATALKSMKRANSGVTWIRQPHVTALLKDLAVVPQITHDSLDKLPRSRTRDYVRGLLVEHGALPRRDETKIRYQEWAAEALNRLQDPRMRATVESYIRWQHLRRMNQMERVSHGTFLRSKQTVTVAIEFLNWLTTEGVELAELRQGDLDRWIATGPTTRLIADRFITWAIKGKLVTSDLTLPKHRRGTSRRLGTAEQRQAIQQVVHTDEMTPRDRAAAILVLVFAQRVENVARLTWDDVTITDDLVTVKLSDLEIALPEPLDGPWRQLAANPGNGQTAAHPNSNWVFRGYSPGEHINAMSLRERLRRVFGPLAARLGTLAELSTMAPVAIIAEALGYHRSTIERHAVDAGATYAEYVAAIDAKH